MLVPLNTNSPFSYPTWLKYQNALKPNTSVELYNQYLFEWYSKNTITTAASTKEKIKNDYIQLLKDLSFLFNKDDQNLFLSQLDYNNDEELIIAIPYFVQKLKEVSKILSTKRESVKNAKIRYNLIGSNEGLETLLYQYVLNGFTSRENNITQVPSTSLAKFFPALSSINGNFFIEVEELHDSQNYLDSDPSVSINQYVNLDQIQGEMPFESFYTQEEILGLLSTRYLSRVADTPLSRLFNQYLMEVPMLSTVALSAAPFQNIYNQIAASQKYLGENVYGLTAVRLSEVHTPDGILNLNIEQGNNWFYWPSGDRVVDDSIFNNIFEPILINNSNFVKCSATGGNDYTNSDLLFTDQSGIIDGAWLQGPRTEYSSGNMQLTINAGETREFIYPYPGFVLTSRGTNFGGYSLTDADYIIYEKLVPQQRTKILNQYYTQQLPNSAAVPIYLNNTNLLYSGAHASSSSIGADTITVRSSNQSINNSYSDYLSGDTQQAFLFALNSTDFPVSVGTTDVLWPIGSFDSNTNLPITVTSDTCIPVNLSDLDISVSMLGAVAGTNINDSDVIYKLNARTTQPLEAAWLGSGSIQNLQILNTINIYNTSATNCAIYLDGQIQAGLSTQIKSGKYISFVWMDEDTPADDVIFYREHSVDCPYYRNGPYNYFTDQDYQNPKPVNHFSPWTNCTCKSVYYSPLGNQGSTLSDYNAMADYLFADPQGLGSDFALNTWEDTRGYNVYTSPQFSFYQLDGITGDMGVGFGSGKWKTGSGKRMILKTGRRYTYYRTSLRSDLATTAPYIVITYPYKKIIGSHAPNKPLDLVVLIDVSASQFNNIQNNINIAREFILELFSNSNQQIQVSIVSFDTTATLQTYLTNNIGTALVALNNIQIPYGNSNQYKTDIYAALQLANSIFTTEVINENKTSNTVYSLCGSLNAAISKLALSEATANLPNYSANRNILIFSDGYENVEAGNAIPYANSLQANGIKIVSVAIGANTFFTDLMKQISSPNSYFDLESYLITNDGNQYNFIQRLVTFFTSTLVYPTWFKAIRGANGTWTPTYEISDMQFLPGDYFTYVHQSNTTYIGNNNTGFSMPSINFAFNAKLNGWDYYTNSFSPLNIGNGFGAKPFWAVSNVAPDPNTYDKFFKGDLAYGGQVQFFDGYVPIHQPKISPIILNNGDFIQYFRNTNSNLLWNQPLNFSVSLSTYQWNKIIFYEGVSNLSDLLRVNNISDLIAYSSEEPSTMLLEGYTSFLPNKYNYYARKKFNYTENLFFTNRCLTSFVEFNTAVAIKTVQPYANLTNVHFPTVASVSLPSLAVTDKQVGEYLLPENLGVSYYRGRGYKMQVSGDTLSFIDSISAERMFLDTNKYGPRNRGLTKKDQNSPVTITDIDNRWMMQSYSSSEAAGLIVDTLNNQKFTPYQTKYEITKINNSGLSRQDDDFQFWNPPFPAVWDQSANYPLTFRKELLSSSYLEIQQKLLVNNGVMLDWKNDIFGNDYGLFKTPGLTVKLPNIYSTYLGVLSASAYGCPSTNSKDIIISLSTILSSIPSNKVGALTHSATVSASYVGNPLVYLPLPRLSS